jgi:hypothetical protein
LAGSHPPLTTYTGQQPLPPQQQLRSLAGKAAIPSPVKGQ